ncbi:MAG TPA: phage holin family protein [Micromonosporaceae bacterium]
MGILIRVVITAIALWVAAIVVPGIRISSGGTWGDILALALMALIVAVINAFLKPVVKVVGCPLYILTLGLFALVVNGLLLWFASWIAEQLSIPFHVDGFWPAFWGAIIVGVVSWLLNLVVPDARPS